MVIAHRQLIELNCALAIERLNQF